VRTRVHICPVREERIARESRRQRSLGGKKRSSPCVGSARIIGELPGAPGEYYPTVRHHRASAAAGEGDPEETRTKGAPDSRRARVRGGGRVRNVTCTLVITQRAGATHSRTRATRDQRPRRGLQREDPT